MGIDSSKFDLRLMNSGVISRNTSLDMSQGLALGFEEIIRSLPDEEESLEIRLRSIVNILVVSKLQAQIDRRELERAKRLIDSHQEGILMAQPAIYGTCATLSLDHWTVINLSDSSDQSSQLICEDLTDIFYDLSMTKHFILDLSRLRNLDLELASYIIGVHDTLGAEGRQLSLVWLPSAALSNISSITHGLLMTKYKLFQKGSFLITNEPARYY